MYSASIAVADDTVEYDDIYRAERARVLRLCQLLLGNPDDAAEVTQEVFLKLHRALPDAANDMRWGAWLTTVAVNACRDLRRSWFWRWRRAGETFDEHLHFGVGGLTAEDAALSRETRLHIWTAFRALSARQREVFALRYFEGWSTDEVADLLDISGGSVKQHLFRAVQQLRTALRGSRS